MGKKGVENVGESKLTVRLKPKRPTTLILMFDGANVHSVDFKAGVGNAHVSVSIT